MCRVSLCSVTVAWSEVLENLVNELPSGLGPELHPWVFRGYTLAHSDTTVSTSVCCQFWSLVTLVCSWVFRCTNMSWFCIVPSLGIGKAVLLNDKILSLCFFPPSLEKNQKHPPLAPLKQNICLFHEAHYTLSLQCNSQADRLISFTICLLLLWVQQYVQRRQRAAVS